MDIIEQTCEVLRQVADPTRGTVELSEAVAEALRKLGKRREDALEQLAQEVANCTKCDLHKTRTQTVFGGGDINARLVFVGEAPGAEEDAQGIPFVGRAGQLLTRIIERGMKLRRKDVYICNVIKCRPPENRDPTPYEKAQCEPYLVRQLELIKPKVICALGAHAAQTLLKTSEPTGKLRGRWHFYHGIPLRVTYHPAYLLRSPQDKRKTWEDVLEVLKVYHGEFTPTPSVESIEDLTYGR
jgi:uracil-DNA glycosylase